MKQAAAARRASSPAFSIIETLVAIGILLVAITGPMVFAQTSLRDAEYARDQITAFFLAQDAIEFVKHIRDENSLTQGRVHWLDGLAECLGQPCMVSSADVDIGSAPDGSEFATPCPPNGAVPSESCRLWVELASPGDGSPSNLYGVGGDNRVKSKFVRTVEIDPAPGMSQDDEVEVSVKIYWQSHPLLPAREIDVREDIMNWIQ